MVNVNKVNLADDIIEANILTRLPVKTLIRFRAVCKSWYSLLSDAYFLNIRKQIQKNCKNNLLIVYYRLERDLKVVDHCSREIFPSFVNICDFPYKSVSMVGCCEGIVCVYGTAANGTTQHISLWNPALRIYKIIAIDMQRDRLYIGFGYHKTMSDYKVIKFTTNFGRIKDVMIYSMNSNSWRKIELCANELCNNYYYEDEIGVYVSCCHGGAYYWIVVSETDDESYRIISFCMNDEVFKEIVLPTSATLCCDGEIEIFNYKDSLALLHICLGVANIKSRIWTIWVMKECNDHNSWTKLCEIDIKGYVYCCGVIESKLMMGSVKKKINELDIEKSEMKTERSIDELGFLREATWVTSFDESLTLLSNKKFL